jgi:hypothetical protein
MMENVGGRFGGRSVGARTGRRAVLAFLVPLLLAPALASAQTADQLAAQAEKDARARKLDLAIEGYRKAYDLSSDPTYLYNIGLLSLVNKDPLQAWQYAVRYQDAARGESDRQDAQRLIEKAEVDLAKTHGKLGVRVVPDKAQVWVDQKNRDGKMLRPVQWVIPGLHVIYAEAPGFEAGEAQVSVNPGIKSEVSVVLRARQASLRVESRTRGAVVFVDGIRIGDAPAESSVGAGGHQVRAEAAGFKPFEQRVELGAGETIVVHADLTPASRDTGTVRGNVAAPPPSKPAHGTKWIAGWACVGVGAAAAIAGSVTYALAYKDYKDAGNLDPLKYDQTTAGQVKFNNDFDAKIDSGSKKAYASYGLWGGGAALVATGIALIVLDGQSGAAIVPTGNGVAATFRW